MAISQAEGTFHASEKHLAKLAKGYQKYSETDSLFSHELDEQFSGEKTLHIKDIMSYPLEDYNRSADIRTASRYGTPTEVGDTEMTFTITQDRSKPLTVDRGYNEEQNRMKSAQAVMDKEIEEQITPEVDKYRLSKWAEEAGTHLVLTAEPTKDTIVETIINAHNDMVDSGVPDSGITLLIKRKYLPALKLAPEWTKLDSLGGKTLPKGTIGEFDGMAVKPITSSKFHNNAAFMLLRKDAVIAPIRFKEWKLHTNPPHISGMLMEFRMIYDAFVLGHKAKGVLVGCLPNTVTTTPTISMSGANATLTSAGATIYYTLNGSDPRYSVDVKTYTGSAVAVPAGATIKAYAKKDGSFASAVAEKYYAG